MWLAPSVAPTLRRLSLSLSGCLLLALLDVGDASSDSDTSTLPPPTSTTTSTSTTQQDADTVTCYTCVNVSDNLICNRFAIDRPCPRGEPFCHTLHIMDSRGHSVVVHKKCAPPEECTPRTVGCIDIDAQRICVSCCDEMYCNEAVPVNHTTAVFSATRSVLLNQQTTPSSINPDHSAATPPYVVSHSVLLGAALCFVWSVMT